MLNNHIDYILENYHLQGEDIIGKRGVLKGHLADNGYLKTAIGLGAKGKCLYTTIHRLKFLLAYGYLPKAVDHINGDRADNRLANLRESCYTRNNRNNHGHKNRKCRYKGLKHSCGKYEVNIAKMYGGRYADEELAALVYDAYAMHLFGEYAALNFP